MLSRIYYYPIYAVLRRLGRESGAAAATAGAMVHRFFAGERAKQHQPGMLQLQVYEWIMEDLPALELDGEGVDATREEALYQKECPAGVDVETLFPQLWRLSVMEEALRAVEQRYQAKQQTRLFDALVKALAGPLRSSEYAQASRELGVPDSVLRVAADQLRGRYRDELKRCFYLAQGGGVPPSLEEELRPLAEV